jgi:hypothetical protein
VLEHAPARASIATDTNVTPIFRDLMGLPLASVLRAPSLAQQEGSEDFID